MGDLVFYDQQTLKELLRYTHHDFETRGYNDGSWIKNGEKRRIIYLGQDLDRYYGVLHPLQKNIKKSERKEGGHQAWIDSLGQFDSLFASTRNNPQKKLIEVTFPNLGVFLVEHEPGPGTIEGESTLLGDFPLLLSKER